MKSLKLGGFQSRRVKLAPRTYQGRDDPLEAGHAHERVERLLIRHGVVLGPSVVLHVERGGKQG